jgi:HTH-type transcriptional regulator/antitoxin HigA
MEALNWSQEDLSDIIGMSSKSISQMINNKQSITVETAILLAKAFDSSPEFWLNLEQNYRLRLKEETEKEKETATGCNCENT